VDVFLHLMMELVQPVKCHAFRLRGSLLSERLCPE
jgi:hypothetical protein